MHVELQRQWAQRSSGQARRVPLGPPLPFALHTEPPQTRAPGRRAGKGGDPWIIPRRTRKRRARAAGSPSRTSARGQPAKWPRYYYGCGESEAAHNGRRSRYQQQMDARNSGPTRRAERRSGSSAHASTLSNTRKRDAAAKLLTFAFRRETRRAPCRRKEERRKCRVGQPFSQCVVDGRKMHRDAKTRK